MTRSEAVALISGRLGSRSGLEATIITELKARQSLLEMGATLPWFLQKASTLTLAAQDVNLPADFIRVDDEAKWWIAGDEENTEFVKEDLSVLMGDSTVQGTGTPQAWAFLNDLQIRCFPAPDTSYTATIFYFAKDDLLAADSTENKWLKYAHDLLVAETGWQVARYLRDGQAMELFAADRGEAISRMIKSNIARTEFGRDAIFGGAV